jgi:xanthine/uracil permease
LVVAIVPIFIIPGAGFLIFALVILVGNWLTLKRLRLLEFPETYKQQSLIASVIFTVGILISVISFYSALYIF